MKKGTFENWTKNDARGPKRKKLGIVIELNFHH